MNRFSYADESESKSRIRVIGIGGAAGNAINWMIHEDFRGIEFVVINTDIQALAMSAALHRIQIGQTVTQGGSAGFDPDVGRRAAEEDRDAIHAALDGADMVILLAGMGRGTGQGASPFIAALARECKALTVAIVTKPFAFEGKVRMQQAETGIEILRDCVDAMIVVPNELLVKNIGPEASLSDTYHQVDDFLHKAVKGITDLATVSGPWSLEMAVLRKAFTQKGAASLGMGTARGEQRAIQATREAISSRLLEEVSLRGAHTLLVSFTGGQNMTFREIDEATKILYEAASENCDLRISTLVGPTTSEDISVTVIATGLNGRCPLRSEVVRNPALDFVSKNGKNNKAPKYSAPVPVTEIVNGEARRVTVGGDELPLNCPTVPPFLT
jgi:cell division protein FtsZ